MEVINSTGFGGMQLQTLSFSGSTGKVGVDARDVPIAVRLTIGDIDASGDATPYLLFGKGSFTVPASNSGLRITGGDLYQSNGALIVAMSEADNMVFQSNVKSDWTQMQAQSMKGSFSFTDQQVVQSLLPRSFNGKTTSFTPLGEPENPVGIKFSGDTFGTFEILVDPSIKADGSFRITFNSKHSDRLWLTLIFEKMTINTEGTVISLFMEELALLTEDPVIKSVTYQMIFFTSTSGIYVANSTFFNSSPYTIDGRFREL